tara:strand:- start:3905 stop:4195 length:291 start_codon:yes stop_codon:yes gene_type:complete
MTLLKKIEKIDKLELQNRGLLLQIINLQKEHQLLLANYNSMSENLTLLSATITENAIVQNFIADQVATNHEIVTEIDKLLHPSSYLKYDLTNEPYN